MRYTLRTLCGAFLLFTFNAQAISADLKSGLPTVTEGELANGLRYTLIPIHSDKGRLDIRLNVEVGSLDETSAQSGVAHMVEHMVFRASNSWPEGVASALTTQGWKRGLNYNAVTNYERTQFMMSPPDGVKGLDLSLQALEQIASQASIRQVDLDDERKVILEEWRGKLGVAARMNEQRIAALREGSRYPLRPTIGQVESIKHTPATTLADFYHRWYQPENMRLLIIGDISPEEARTKISHVFSSLPSITVTIRSTKDYDQQLKDQLRVVRLQDDESGGSQVSWVTRFEEGYTLGIAGFRERLIDQITLSALTRQLKRQRDALPDTVGSMVARKSEIGRTTVAFGLFADVMPGSFEEGLDTVITERERLVRYGISSQDIESVKAELVESAQRMKDKPEMRAFSDWVQVISVAWQKNEPYTGTQMRGTLALKELSTITPDTVNARLRNWLQAQDKLVQFSIPGRMQYNIPLPSAVEKTVSRIAARPLLPTPDAATAVLPSLPEHTTEGTILSAKNFATEQVQEWQLSNGDRVVWKRTPLAKDRVWIQAVSQAGYLSEGVVGWSSQLAAQLAAHGAPAGWSEDDYQRWLSDNNTTLNVSQASGSLEVSGSAVNTSLNKLMQAYQLLYVDNHLDAASVKSSLLGLARRQVMQGSTLSAQRDKEVSALRYGARTFPVPTQAELTAVTAANLESQWKTLSTAPVTYFIMGNLPESDVKKAVEHYLAGIQRLQPLAYQPYLPEKGARERVSHLSSEPKADISLWTFRDEVWTPERAVQVSIARNLMNQHLKAVLRDDARGIYNLRFDSELNDKSNRIESQLRFSTSPERAEEMINLAKRALSEAGSGIGEPAVREQKVIFDKAEASRQQDFITLQRRLRLSYQHFNSPVYLSRVDSLDKAITPEGIRSMATRLYDPKNLTVYTVLPQEDQQ
ncbi:peptidase M16 [Pantoea sp. VS1]|uniref:M16 family metallopeptidase n=1 Tax=Pantoea sp. VS1 TaxID=2003658 RepID=UPI000B504C00|nr:insulinase family protein [Pantoea sp. VS1]OWS75407.1 peptidase M16 [Pantoea sp. VS1]